MTELAYTAAGPIQVPDIQILKLEPGWKTEALRGYGYIVAVMNHKGECIGWTNNPKPAP